MLSWMAPEPEPMPEQPQHPISPNDDLLSGIMPRQDSEDEYARRKDEYKQAQEAYDEELKRRKSFHDDTSKTIRRVFYALTGTCLFCILTLSGSPDSALLSPKAAVTLPVLNYKINFAAFLIVGPFLLVTLTIYLHIFVAQHRVTLIPVKHRLPMLPNFDSSAARFTVWLVYYWIVPATLVYFVWKAWPQPFEGWLLFDSSVVVVALLVALQIRRCSSEWRLWAIPMLIVSIIAYPIGVYELTTTRHINLFKADLHNQDLRGTNLFRAFLEEANLNNAQLSKAGLIGANLSGADLSDADLSEAYLSVANLSGADLRRAKLNGANLSDADLSEADLSEADLSGANLSGADLRTTQGLDQARLDEACGDSKTRLPEGWTIPPCPA